MLTLKTTNVAESKVVNTWWGILFLWIGKFNIFNKLIFLKLMYRFNEIPIKYQEKFCECWQVESNIKIGNANNHRTMNITFAKIYKK